MCEQEFGNIIFKHPILKNLGDKEFQYGGITASKRGLFVGKEFESDGVSPAIHLFGKCWRPLDTKKARIPSRGHDALWYLIRECEGFSDYIDWHDANIMFKGWMDIENFKRSWIYFFGVEILGPIYRKIKK